MLIDGIYSFVTDFLLKFMRKDHYSKNFLWEIKWLVSKMTRLAWVRYHRFFKSNAFETFHYPHMIDHEKLHMTNYYFSKSSSSKK